MQKKTWMDHNVNKYEQAYTEIALLFALLYKPSIDRAEIEAWRSYQL
jgi:hypothetical protein